MKKCVMMGAALTAFLAFGAGADIGGNAITGETLFGDVDGAKTTVGDVLAVGGDESDPKFNAWTNGTSLAAGQGAKAAAPYSTAVGPGAYAGSTNPYGYSSAFGYNAYAGWLGSTALGYRACTPRTYSLGTYYGPASIYLRCGGSGAVPSSDYRALLSYCRDRLVTLTAEDVAAFSPYYGLQAEDGVLYDVTAGSDGFMVTLPGWGVITSMWDWGGGGDYEKCYMVRFTIRLSPADANGTRITEVDPGFWMGGEVSYDYPDGAGKVFGTVTNAVYISFDLVSYDTNNDNARWRITARDATKAE